MKGKERELFVLSTYAPRCNFSALVTSTHVWDCLPLSCFCSVLRAEFCSFELYPWQSKCDISNIKRYSIPSELFMNLSPQIWISYQSDHSKVVLLFCLLNSFCKDPVTLTECFSSVEVCFVLWEKSHCFCSLMRTLTKYVRSCYGWDNSVPGFNSLLDLNWLNNRNLPESEAGRDVTQPSRHAD